MTDELIRSLGDAIIDLENKCYEDPQNESDYLNEMSNIMYSLSIDELDDVMEYVDMNIDKK